MIVTVLRNSFLENLSLNNENFSVILGLILVQLKLNPNDTQTPNSCVTYFNPNLMQYWRNNLSIQVFFLKIHLFTQKFNQLNFISRLINFTNYLPTPNESKLKIFHILREISIIDFNTFTKSLKSNFSANEVLFSIFQKFRFLNVICELLLDFFLGPKLTHEKKEIITLFSEKQVLFFYKIISKMNISEKIYGKKQYKNILPGYKISKHLFFLKIKQIKMVSFQKFLYTSILNGILTNKLINDKFSFHFHQKNIWNRLKINGKIKNLIKFIKKEIFFCSTNIFLKYLRKNILRKLDHFFLKLTKIPFLVFINLMFYINFLTF